MTNKPTERKLNDDQLAILKLLLKFRFITRQSITKLFANSRPGMDVYRKLQVLENRGLIAKRFDPSYRLLGKPAAYYLLPNGARKLQENPEAAESKTHIKGIYKDKFVSEQFIDECLDIFITYIALQEHSADLKFFTRSDLNHEDYSYFPQPLPDAYMRFENGRQYFLFMHYKYQPFFVLTRAVKQLVEYFENGIWDDTGTNFPVVLFVVDNAKTRERLHTFINKNVEDMKIHVALKDDVIGGNEKIWHDTHESNETHSLKELEDIDAT